MSEVQEQVKKIIVDHLGIDESKVTPESKFIDDLGADSLDTVELVMAFEEKFGQPDDVASLVYFLSTSEASYITGQNFHVNGGMLMV